MTSYEKTAQTEVITYSFGVAYCKYLNGWQMDAYRSMFTAIMNNAERPTKLKYNWNITAESLYISSESAPNMVEIPNDHKIIETTPMIRSLKHKHPRAAFAGVCSDAVLTNAIRKGAFRHTTVIERTSWKKTWILEKSTSQYMMNICMQFLTPTGSKERTPFKRDAYVNTTCIIGNSDWSSSWHYRKNPLTYLFWDSHSVQGTWVWNSAE